MRKFILGVVLGATLTGTLTVFGANGRMIEIFDNVKNIVVNDSDKPFDEKNKPFVYNGTTYVPLRFVADALGERVDWDGKTGTVYIGGINSQQENPYLKILGTWDGTYTNGIGEQGVTIEIYQNSYGELEANFKFYPIANNLNGGTGEFISSVDYNTKTGVIKFKAKKEIDLPKGWVMVDYTAVVSNGTISGKMDGYSSRPLEVKKIK